MYHRVLPRDLFNEAKLLKCLGKLCLLIEDQLCKLSYIHDDTDNPGFTISQLPECGGIYTVNLEFYTPRGHELVVNSPLNSRRDWPLLCTWAGVELPVFDDNGALSAEFRKCEEDW
jgi:hypothetical protein